MSSTTPKYGAPLNHRGLLLPPDCEHIDNRAIELAMKPELSVVERVELQALCIWRRYHVTSDYLCDLLLTARGLSTNYLDEPESKLNRELYERVTEELRTLLGHIHALSAGRPYDWRR